MRDGHMDRLSTSRVCELKTGDKAAHALHVLASAEAGVPAGHRFVSGESAVFGRPLGCQAKTQHGCRRQAMRHGTLDEWLAPKAKLEVVQA
eukprot:CAMPEP_0174697840 /NCGR_PEP_ID=MMETSP1094-20130205/3590_1 /TAXON_ID=156173 /ORGANISM="Chrysochromulina brevifilum, Strain UTEX LB 985" /LENGTH=90 /DNA_ID=CAMNT_0015894907 /DNA_START=858 /DNA_END=1131 /DNA_ORIENTATION=+